METPKDNLRTRIANWEKSHPVEFTVIVTLALICIIYSFFRLDFDYWDGAIGNLIASLIAVIVGIPIAFEIERWRQEQEERKQKSERTARACTIVSLIRDEMCVNLQRINLVATNPKGAVYVSIVSDEVWRALSSSGEIRWIDNSEVLAEIAMAYYFTSIISKMADDAYDTDNGFNVRYGRGSREAVSLKSHLIETAPGIATRLQRTIKLISETYGLSAK
jgi:hypothetical protein